MSNEDTLRRAYDAWNRSDIDALLELVHPDGEMRPILGANFAADVYRGHEGARRWMEDLQGEWERFETRLADIEEHDDRLICTVRIDARGRASGIVVEGELFHLITFRDGLIYGLTGFRDRGSAVAALEAT